MDQKATDTGWRGSPEVWLETACDTLIDSGVDAARILPLAERPSDAGTVP